ncbi:hypothetical protein AB4K20DRAFT_1921116, partial [Rhizopus microsporus]
GSACSIGLFLSAPSVCFFLLFSYCFLQANGLHARLETVHLTGPGLFAAIHQGIIHFPRNLSSFDDFKQSLTLFFTVVSDLERNATIDCIDDCGDTIRTTINRQYSWIEGSRLTKAT